MTFTFEVDLDRTKLNQLTKYLCQRSFGSDVNVRTFRQTHTHTLNGPTALPATKVIVAYSIVR